MQMLDTQMLDTTMTTTTMNEQIALPEKNDDNGNDIQGASTRINFARW